MNKGILRYLVLILLMICCWLSIFYDFNSFWIPPDADKWLAFTADLAKKISDPNYIMTLNFDNYNHSFTPLYPVIGALLGQIFEISVALSIESILFSLGSIWVLNRLLKEHYDLDQSERSLVLLLFIPNQMMMLYFAVQTFTTQIVLFFTLSNLYLWQKYSKLPSIRNAVLLAISYSLTVYCREILWPMLAIPTLSFLLTTILKRKTEKVFRWENIIKCLKIVGLTLITPVLTYLPFFLNFQGFARMTSAWNYLITHQKLMSEFLLSCVLAFGFLWIFTFLRIKQIVTDPRNNTLILWAVYFFGYRVIAPGPFYGFYWIPIIPIIVIFAYLALRGLSFKIHDREIKIVYPIIIVNVIIQLLFFQHIFLSYLRPW